MTNIGGGRILKVCDICGGVDDHPRHSFAGTTVGIFEVDPRIVALVAQNAPAEQVDRLVADVLDTSSQERHLDCCAEVGCPTGSCNDIMKAAGSRRGAALLKHIMKG